MGRDVFANGHSTRPRILSAALLLLTALSLPACAEREGAIRTYRNMDPAVGYVGREACLACHAQVGETFAATGMGRSLYPLTPERVVEDFTSRNRIEIPADGVAYEMLARDGDHFMKLTVLDRDGTALASSEKKIAYVIGSGNHSRSYVTEDAGGIYQMPVCWYPDKPGWDLCPGYEMNHEQFGRRIEPSCLFCHDARVTPVRGTQNRYTVPLPHGIDCERCHGPGELHVARWRRSGDHPPSGDDTIVNPKSLPRETRMQVCLQCHLGDSDAGARIARPGRDMRDFRPGGHIGEYLDVLAFDPPMEDRFGLGSQGDRLMLSRCYKESGGGVDCLTCHDPHVSVYSKSRPADQFRKACLTCHTAASCELPETDRRARVATDDCIACHMRRSVPSDQRFTAFTDHWIRRRIHPPGLPAPDWTARTLRVIRAGGARTAAREEPAFSLGVAYFVKKTEGTYASLIPWAEPERHLRAAIEKEPRLAEGWHMLGTVALRQGHVSEAIGDFREALKLEPGHDRARRQLAAALLIQGRAAEAAPLLRAAVEENPYDAAAMSDLARALVVMGEEVEAGEILARALALSPGTPTILANQGLLEAHLGRHEAAVERLREAGALDPATPEVWDALAGSLLELGRVREAVGPARRAVFLRPTLPTAQYHLGAALAAAGDARGAEDALKMAVTLRPGYREAIAALKRLPPKGTIAQTGGSSRARPPGGSPVR